MKAITLHQPWATLVAIEAKRIETRSWATKYRGPLAIHAGKNSRYVRLSWGSPYLDAIIAAGEKYTGEIPLGAIVATCELVHVKKVDEFDWLPTQTAWEFHGRYWYASEQEKAFGDYTIGRYMWFLANIEILKDPIYCNGARRLWEIDL